MRRTDYLTLLAGVAACLWLAAASTASAEPPRGGPGGPGLGAGRGGPPEPRFPPAVGRNDDGKLTKDEVPEPLWPRLAQLDADEDGAISRDELAQHPVRQARCSAPWAATGRAVTKDDDGDDQDMDRRRRQGRGPQAAAKSRRTTGPQSRCRRESWPPSTAGRPGKSIPNAKARRRGQTLWSRPGFRSPRRGQQRDQTVWSRPGGGSPWARGGGRGPQFGRGFPGPRGPGMERDQTVWSRPGAGSSWSRGGGRGPQFGRGFPGPHGPGMARGPAWSGQVGPANRALQMHRLQGRHSQSAMRMKAKASVQQQMRRGPAASPFRTCSAGTGIAGIGVPSAPPRSGRAIAGQGPGPSSTGRTRAELPHSTGFAGPPQPRRMGDQPRQSFGQRPNRLGADPNTRGRTRRAGPVVDRQGPAGRPSWWANRPGRFFAWRGPWAS